VKPYVVLGIYHPPWPQEQWKAWKIGRGLCQITSGHDLVPHVDPAHGPEPGASWSNVELHAQVRRFTMASGMGDDWHQDGDTTPGSKMDCAMVLWTSGPHVQLKFAMDKTDPILKNVVYQPNPYEVVLISNLLAYHRRPPGCPRERWVFRQRVAMPTHIKLP